MSWSGSSLVRFTLNLNPLPLYVPFAKVWKGLYVGDPEVGSSWVTATSISAFTFVAVTPSKSTLASTSETESNKSEGKNASVRKWRFRSMLNTLPKSKNAVPGAPPNSYVPSGAIPPISSNEPTISKLLILSNSPIPDKFKEFVVASKATLVFIPWNFGASKSSRLDKATKDARLSGKSKITLASPALNLPPSSWNFKIYSPSKYGTSAVVVFPARASIKSVASENVAVPSVFVECLT